MLPQWATGIRPVIQILAAAIPALVIVIFAGIIALLALACESGRREYALAFADRAVDLSAVLIGAPRSPKPKGTSKKST